VVGHAEHEILKIDKFAWYVDGNDLPGSARQDLLPVRKSLNDQSAGFDRRSLLNDVGLTRELLVAPRQVEDSTHVLVT
jgi:hypothetical protein